MSPQTIDMRSDTVTQPGPEMREVISRAPVGDDVFGDDPTVIELESVVASLLGKQAAVFVPSGTMANQIAVACHTERGDEILLEETCHIFQYEAGAAAALSGVQTRPIRGEAGLPPAAEIRAAIRGRDPHFPISRLLCLENTHNRAGGRVLPFDRTAELIEIARSHGLSCHLDGARLWNAAAASGDSEGTIAAPFDSVSVCFSKGLGAPVGSIIAGTSVFIDRARHTRKRFGGGMRQSGLLAAAALYALKNHRPNLIKDHRRARSLAEALDRAPGVKCDLSTIETNIVLCEIETGEVAEWLEAFETEGLRAVPMGGTSIRFVTHLEIDDEALDRATEIVERVATRFS